jgi:hypothetical protein
MNVLRAMVGERKIDHGDRMAGFSGIVGFGILFFGRVTGEEGMMLETFGDRYREYMTQTSARKSTRGRYDWGAVNCVAPTLVLTTAAIKFILTLSGTDWRLRC